MARPSIPKFGDWQNDDVPYTVVFQNAKDKRGGKFVNPNDPTSNLAMFPEKIASPALPSRPQPKELTGRGSDKARPNREGAEYGKFSNSPARSYNAGPGPAQPERGYGRAPMPRGGSEHNVDRSSSNPRNQTRPNASPIMEPKIRPNPMPGKAPGKSRMSTPARDVGIPKFGDWDGAEQFTDRFEKHRENNNSDPKYTPSYNTSMKKKQDVDSKFSVRSLFSWWTKLWKK